VSLKPTYSVVIPVYNSDKSVEEIYYRLKEVFNTVVKDTFELVLIDDCSPNPNSWLTCKKLAEDNDNVISVQLSRNFKKPGATLCGLHYANGDYIVLMDDDLQHLPEEIPLLIAKKNHDVVLGIFQERKHNLMKRTLSWLNNWFESKAIGKPIHLRYSPFQLIKKDIVDKIKTIKSPYPYLMGYVYYFTTDIATVTTTHVERPYGESYYTFPKLVGLFSNTLINNSNFLFNFLGGKGIILTVFGFILAISQLIKFLNTQIFDSWIVIIASICMIGGLILIGFGVLGIYLIRMFYTMEQRNAYSVKEVVKRDFES
jgi:glycosyltransferase involved in cell wall biosynthesis